MSAEPLDWYKREQRRFLNATAGWSLENKGAYSVLIDLIMDQPRGLIDNDQWIAGQLGTSVRKWRVIKSFLILHGKISVVDGIISNKKADKVKMIQRSFQDKQAENRRNPNKNKADDPTVVAYREDKKITTNVVKEDTNVSLANKRGTRIDPDWNPSQDDYNQAFKMGLTMQEIDNEAAKFRDYWIAKSGQSATKLDWSATWRNWCRSSKDRRRTASYSNADANQQKSGSRVDAALRALQATKGGGFGW